MDKKEIVINACFGGFSLSHQATMRYAELKGIKLYFWIDDITKKVYGKRATEENPDIDIFLHYSTIPINDEAHYHSLGKFANDNYWSDRDLARDDPILIKVIKELGPKANGKCAELKIIEIPMGIKWQISEYDGNETIEEKHKSWG